MKYYQQFDSSDCGPACIAMIASYFGLTINIAKIREIAGTDSEGTNFKGFLNTAAIYNLKCRTVQGCTESINKNLYTPFIAHTT